jgi:1-acyl-sn-glycerol-3-phosphate acyltransferase
MIRIILVVIFILIVFILSLIAWPIEYIIGRFNPRARDLSSLRLIQGVFRVILFLSGVNLTVKGRENILKGEAALYVGNHRGLFDTIVAYSLMPDLTGFIAKKEMGKVPFIRVWMKILHCLFLDRSNPRAGLTTILKGIEELQNGISIVIFPEGTRNKGDGVMQFHGGSFKLADRSNCRIVPMAINNSDEVFENHLPFIKATRMIIEFCEPIDVAAMDKEQRKALSNMTHDIILETYERNQRELDAVK